MGPVTRRQRRCTHHISNIISSDLWIYLCTTFFFVHDVCRLRLICKIFSTQLVHSCLSFRMKHLTGMHVPIPISNTHAMAHVERVWHGIRMTSLLTSDSAREKFPSIVVLRSEGRGVVGRIHGNEFPDRYVSRRQLVVELLSPDEHLEDNLMGHMYVTGQNPTLYRGRSMCQGSYVSIYLGDIIELVEHTGTVYRVDYL